MKNMYTILINFSDHLIGIGQYESESPEVALKDFINSHESLDGYDRVLLANSIMPLLKPNKIKGVWSFHFNPELMTMEWYENNAVLGGHIIQSEKI